MHEYFGACWCSGNAARACVALLWALHYCGSDSSLGPNFHDIPIWEPRHESLESNGRPGFTLLRSSSTRT
jgi:hypothetical protein